MFPQRGFLYQPRKRYPHPTKDMKERAISQGSSQNNGTVKDMTPIIEIMGPNPAGSLLFYYN